MSADSDQHVDGGRGPQEGAKQVADVARAAALAERRRLARDLHDSVTQTLISLHLTAQAAAELWDTQPEQARAALADGGALRLQRSDQPVLLEHRVV